jgi:hypothetical protein
MRTRSVGKRGARNDGIAISGDIQHKFFNGIQGSWTQSIFGRDVRLLRFIRRADDVAARLSAQSPTALAAIGC